MNAIQSVFFGVGYRLDDIGEHRRSGNAEQLYQLDRFGVILIRYYFNMYLLGLSETCFVSVFFLRFHIGISIKIKVIPDTQANFYLSYRCFV